ncbi:MAG: PQ-loop repeat-containing protein [Halobacteria archaeon]
MSDAIGYFGVLLITACQVPQLAKTVRTRQVEGISALYYLLLVPGIGSMLLYAVQVDRRPFVMSNSVALLVAAAQLALVFKYRRRRDETFKWRETRGGRHDPSGRSGGGGEGGSTP